jgi:hypothetical protein
VTGFLDVAQGHAGVERGGDESVAQGVRPDLHVDAGCSADSSHDAGGRVPVEPITVVAKQDRSFPPLTDGEVDGAGGPWCHGHGDGLAALADHGQCSVAALETEIGDVGTNRFRHAQAVHREQRDQRTRPTTGFEIASERFDMHPLGVEQPDVQVGAPDHELS